MAVVEVNPVPVTVIAVAADPAGSDVGVIDVTVGAVTVGVEGGVVVPELLEPPPAQPVSKTKDTPRQKTREEATALFVMRSIAYDKWNLFA